MESLAGNLKKLGEGRRKESRGRMEEEGMQEGGKEAGGGMEERRGNGGGMEEGRENGVQM